MPDTDSQQSTSNGGKMEISLAKRRPNKTGPEMVSDIASCVEMQEGRSFRGSLENNSISIYWIDGPSAADLWQLLPDTSGWRAWGTSDLIGKYFLNQTRTRFSVNIHHSYSDIALSLAVARFRLSKGRRFDPENSKDRAFVFDILEDSGPSSQYQLAGEISRLVLQHSKPEAGDEEDSTDTASRIAVLSNRLEDIDYERIWFRAYSNLK